MNPSEATYEEIAAELAEVNERLQLLKLAEEQALADWADARDRKEALLQILFEKAGAAREA